MEKDNLKEFEQALRNRIRGEVSFDKVTRGIYATDASIYQITPVAVVLPRDDADVCAAVKTAVEYGVNILPRGGGTSLGGQTVGPSLVIDFSKYMNRIVELNTEERWVRVQPGIILDVLNADLAQHGLLFAPDPATSSRATIGGMMGNNSSGTKSLIYGLTKDHVLSARVLLADGTLLDLKPLSADEYQQRMEDTQRNPREAEILRGFKAIIDANKEDIKQTYPKIMRRVNGYNLDAFAGEAPWNLTTLLVGSEGTLGLFLEARLNLEPLPKSKALCTVHFNSVSEAVRTVAMILEHKPSAVEILDPDVIGMARQNLSVARLCGWIESDPQAILIVEFFGDSPDETEQKCERLAQDLQGKGLGYAWPVMTRADEQAKVWGVRKSGLGLMLGMKGERKPLPFIEDASVPIECLPDYVEQILAFCQARDVKVAMYAHASVGLIHLRPILNLKVQADIDHMKAISDYAFSLVKQYGGAWSGEHGDGRVRSPYLPEFFGAQIYEGLKKVKHLFDPLGVMNPGSIIDANPPDHDLRYGINYQTPGEPTEYHYRSQGSFAAAVEMCTGVGDCRKRLDGTMCPSYRATRDEEHSTRGRANALRLAMTGQLGPQGMTDRRLFEVMDLCLSCKACKSECPSNVDMAQLKGEFLQTYYDAHGARLRDRLIAHSPAIARVLAGRPAAFVNYLLLHNPILRKAIEWTTGFDSTRKLPCYTNKPFPRWFSRRPNPQNSHAKTVVLFDDTYMNFHEPQVGISAVELLESCGYQVILAQAGCCQRPKISHGFLRKAKQQGEKTLHTIDEYLRQDFPVVVCEPSCCSALTDDLPDLVDDEALGQRIKTNVMMIDNFLQQEVDTGRLNCQFSSPFDNLLIHGHCHQKALYGTRAMQNLLKRVPDITVDEINSGCCGMAGSFGYEKEHSELSKQIGEDRLFPAIRKAPTGTTIVANGFSCRHQIADCTDTKAVHWVESIRGHTDVC